MEILKNGEYGVILLEGEPTIDGQIEARNKALKSCLSPRAKKEIHPATLEAWINSHKRTIKILENLKQKNK